MIHFLQVSTFLPEPVGSFEELELLGEGGGGISDKEELVPPEEVPLGRAKRLFHALIEQRRARQFFRLCAMVNILSLVFSAPLVQCGGGKDACTEHFVTFLVIASVDLVMSVLYSIHAIARMEYAFYLYKNRKVCTTHARTHAHTHTHTHMYICVRRAHDSILQTSTMHDSVQVHVYPRYFKCTDKINAKCTDRKTHSCT